MKIEVLKENSAVRKGFCFSIGKQNLMATVRSSHSSFKQNRMFHGTKSGKSLMERLVIISSRIESFMR